METPSRNCDPAEERRRATRARIERDREQMPLGTEERVCEHHGPYTATRFGIGPLPGKGDPTIGAHLAYETNCPQCDKVWQAEADARDAEIRGGANVAEMRRREALRAAGIPPRFETVTVANWLHGMDAQRKVWNWVRDYCDSISTSIESGRSAVFCGGVGTGKSHLACAMARHVIEKGGTGRYSTAVALMARIRSTYNRDATETEQQVIAEMRGVDLLVLDEVGRTQDTRHEQGVIFRLLDERHAHKKPVIVVSNLNPNDLRAFLGDALVDRLRENGGGMLVFDWASQRSKRVPRPAPGQAP